MVVTVKDRTGMTSEENGIVESESEEVVSFADELYNPNGYIASVGQARPNFEFPAGVDVCVIQGDRFDQRQDDLATLEGDFANLHFFNEQDPGDMAVNWFDFEKSTEVTEWLDDQPDVVEESQPEQGPSGVSTSVVAGRAGDHNALPESAGAKKFARDLGIVNIGNGEQAVLK